MLVKEKNRPCNSIMAKYFTEKNLFFYFTYLYDKNTIFWLKMIDFNILKWIALIQNKKKLLHIE